MSESSSIQNTVKPICLALGKVHCQVRPASWLSARWSETTKRSAVIGTFHASLRFGVLGAAVVFFLALSPAIRADSTTPDITRPALTVDAPLRGSLRSMLRPWSDLQLSAKAAGVIAKFFVEEGAMIKAGDPILSLDSAEEQAEVMQAEAAVRGANAEAGRATAELERVKPLTNEKIYSEKQYIEAKTLAEIARSRLDQAQAALATAKARLANRTVISPIDGIFLKTNKSVGEAVERFETVARVVDVSRIEMTIYCDGRYYDKLKHVKSVEVKIVKSIDNQPIVKAEVVHIDPIIDPLSLTFRIKLQLAPASTVASGYAAILLLPAD